MNDSANLPFIPLETADLSVLKPDDLHRFVADAVVNVVLLSPAGVRVDRRRFAALIDSHVDALFSGNELDFGPVLRALLRVPGVFEEQLYVASFNLKEQLRQRNIKLIDPPFTIDHHTRAQLLEEAHQATEAARRAHEKERLEGAVRDLNRARLGDLLLHQGIIDETQLAEALEAQQQTGGRLGSNLVELGYLQPTELASFLGEQLGLPFLTEIDRVNPEAVALVPAELAVEHNVMPVEFNGVTLQLAMVDPTRLDVIEALGARTGKRVEPLVAPELAVRYALARYYGVEQPARFILRDLSPEELSPKMTEAEPPRSAGQVRGLQELSARLLKCEEPDEVLTAFMHHFSRAYGIVGLFRVVGSSVEGWAQVGAQVSPQDFRNQRLPSRSHPLLEEYTAKTEIYYGPGSMEVGSQWITDTLGLNRKARITLIPLSNHTGKIIALAIGHRPRAEDRARDTQLQLLGSAGIAMAELRGRIRNAAR